MSHHDQAAARIHSLRWFLKNTARIARFDRMKGRRRGGERIALSIDHLESRTLLTVSALIGPVPSSPPGPVPASETLNLQLVPGTTTLSSVLTPLIESRSASVQATSVPPVRAPGNQFGEPSTSFPHCLQPTRRSSMPSLRRP